MLRKEAIQQRRKEHYMSETKQASSVDEIEHDPPITPHHVGQVPQWTVSVGILLIGILYLFLPEKLTIGPNWLLLALETAVLAPLWVFYLAGRILPYRVVRMLSLILLGLVTIALAGSVVTLIIELPSIKAGNTLLRTAALLWLSNVVVFGLWYWDTDGGGPRKRHETGHVATDFLFPQQANGTSWAPQFADYVFVAFTAATAFSPTDTYPLTQRAKILMMIQSIISLMIIGILVSRVANIL
jgi:hypothetical protein